MVFKRRKRGPTDRQLQKAFQKGATQFLKGGGLSFDKMVAGDTEAEVHAAMKSVGVKEGQYKVRRHKERFIGGPAWLIDDPHFGDYVELFMKTCKKDDAKKEVA